MLAHWNNCLLVDMSPHSDTLSWFWAFALSPKCCMFSGEATNTNLIVFGLTRSGREPTIYCTQGEHANYYTTDAVDGWTDRMKTMSHQKREDIIIYTFTASEMPLFQNMTLTSYLSSYMRSFDDKSHGYKSNTNKTVYIEMSSLNNVIYITLNIMH